jgi:intracellular septation protein A
MPVQEQVRAEILGAPTTSAGVPGGHEEPHHRHSPLAVLGAVARRGLPHIIEATVVPAVLFYVALVVFGIGAAFAVALIWSFGAIARRLLMGRRVPPLLLLASVGLTVRTVIAVASGSTFVYFLQPALTTMTMGAVFLGSIAIGKPLIARFAHDFCPLAPEVAGRDGVVRLFRSLTYLWAGVNFLTALTNLVLLEALSLESFVAAKTVSGWGITVAAVALTVNASIRTARCEGLVGEGSSGALMAALMSPRR